MAHKKVIILWMAMIGAVWVEATPEEDTILGKQLEHDLYLPRRFRNYDPLFYDENVTIDPEFLPKNFEMVPSTTQLTEVPSLVPPPVHPEQVSHRTAPLVSNSVPNPAKAPTVNLLSKESTSPQPSSTTERDFPQQLLPSLSLVVENHSSEEPSFSVASTTEGSIFEEKSSITPEKIEPPIQLISIEMAYVVSVSSIILLIILLIVIKIHWRIRKTAAMEYKKLSEHPYMVY